MIKQRIMKLAGTMLAVIALAGCVGQATTQKGVNKNSLEKVTFVLDWTPNTNHTGLYIAQEKGYFEAAGLEVEIVQPPENGAELLVASGKAQFGVSFQDSLAPALASENPLPVTAVAAVIQHNTSGILSRKGEGMDRPSGLEGKKYATWELPVEQAMVKNVVEADGGSFELVELVPDTVTDEMTALKSKSVDALWIFYAWAGVKMELMGVNVDYFSFADQNPAFDYYTPVIIANQDYLMNHGDTARAFLGALQKGYEDAVKDPEEAAKILCSFVPELDEELVLASQRYLAGQYQAEAKAWGLIDPERWNRFYHWLDTNGLTEVTIPENTGFSNDYLPK